MGDNAWNIDINLISSFAYDHDILNILHEIFLHEGLSVDLKNDLIEIMIRLERDVVSKNISLEELKKVKNFLIAFASYEMYIPLFKKIKSEVSTQKIVLISHIYMSGEKLEDKTYYPYLLWIINNDIKYKIQFKLLRKILGSRLVYIHESKVNAILAAIKFLDYRVSDAGALLIYEILTCNLMLNLSDDYYQKVVFLCFSSNVWNFIYKAINVFYVSRDKLGILINYYYEIVNNEKGDIKFQEEIFNIPLQKELLSLDDLEYEKILNKILNSHNKEIMAIILAMNEEDTKKNSLMQQVEKLGPIKKELVSCFGDIIASFLRLGLEEKYLNLVLELVSEFEKTNDGEKRKVIKAKIQALRMIFNQALIYVDNKIRLDYVLGIILELDSEIIIHSVATFASSGISGYYSDLEFKRVIDVLLDTSDLIGRERTYESSYFILNSLFTSVGVPFVSKDLIIDIAVNSDRKTILEVADKLHTFGVINRNMYGIKNGMSDGEFLNVTQLLDDKFLRELLKK